MKIKNLKGQSFGRLTVIEEAGRDKWKQVLWRCLCVCGKTTIVVGGNLRSGTTKSCGCFNKDQLTTHGMYGSSTHSAWESMKARCGNPNNANYKNYGGRGIKVCEKWHKFESFFEDMGKKPNGLTLERRDNEQGYSKENCKWATYIEQSRNTRIRCTNKTGIKGVSWDKQRQRYQAKICVNYKQILIGRFTNLEAAKAARQQAELTHWG